ncbi:hypothetical protein CTAYLR_003882 [Chrysophaeum taylorii]|uniref:Extrinsic protein in photosystem II n=1 Tax=Chrysophaeum taylorii TaxID=2483200 RepID=A0AAD7UMN5_9STRA|nr:hypothetical protein CTAYLR_003882 [Chrysophaeum taylorii]
MFRASILATTFGAVAGLVPQMKAETSTMVDRRAFGASLGAIGAALSSQAAYAAAGDSPKFSFFGIGGNADTYSEGAAYGIDSDKSEYSPYSPYSKVGEGAYKKYNPEEVAFKKKLLAESTKRVKGIDKYIAGKEWEEVRSELARQVYDMRATMNYLASGKPEATATAKKFYQEMEAVNLLSKRKNQDAALDAYKEMMTTLEAYTKLI